jgi:coniferyl-aldehyde dehydrogenase
MSLRTSSVSHHFSKPPILRIILPRLGVMKEGIFGPILPIIPYDNLESAIDEVNNGKRPLRLYVYSKSLEEVNKIINDTNSGGAAIDVAAMHGALPFSRIW